MRGKPDGTDGIAARRRIIPARAGQTIQASAPEAYAPDHPRACGANWLTSDMLGCRVGSSPRVRGKRPVEHVRGSHTRIIPARAGQTTGAVVVAAHNADHPRACGANRLLAYATRWAAGSSPRVRGKLGGLRVGVVQRRIIPARAGQTEQGRRQGKKARIIPARAGQTLRNHGIPDQRTDHPRACGANDGLTTLQLIECGSSPRVRGKLQFSDQPRWQDRIIPARAGQTPAARHPGEHHADHPRACGANQAAAIAVQHAVGSSPRVRGKLAGCRAGAVQHRIIPARAGQTAGWRRLAPNRPDHPRACGANWAAVARPAAPVGSSPRVRGKPELPYSRVFGGRIIPARAGQTTTKYWSA